MAAKKIILLSRDLDAIEACKNMLSSIKEEESWNYRFVGPIQISTCFVPGEGMFTTLIATMEEIIYEP